MKTQTLWLITITTSIALSLVATLATYNVTSYPTDIIIGAALMYRGWPLHWMIESWTFWGPPTHLHSTFQPVNFLVDLIFYAIIFQIPMQIYMHLKEARKPNTRSNVNPP